MADSERMKNRFKRGRRVRVTFDGYIYGPIATADRDLDGYRIYVPDFYWTAIVPADSVTDLEGGSE
jgi:hypothetical protein